MKNLWLMVIANLFIQTTFAVNKEIDQDNETSSEKKTDALQANADNLFTDIYFIIDKLNHIAGSNAFRAYKQKIIIDNQQQITDENKVELKGILTQYIGQFGIDNSFIEDIEPPMAG